MCSGPDSHPPIEPIAGGALDSKRLELVSADGTSFAAFHARAAHPTGAGIVILPDVRGLSHFYEELSLRFAEAGVDALVIDYFGRTAGTGRRDENFQFMPHVGQTRYEQTVADALAGVADLTADGRVRSVFTVGFCLGGRLSFLMATRTEVSLAGVIGLYGWPVGPNRNDAPAPADVASEIRAPVLALFGGADEGIGPDAVQTFQAALSSAGVDHTIHTYPGAPHSFFDRKQQEFAAESADAWQRVLDFIRERTAG